MSLIINLETLSYETREKISKELELRLENKFGPSKVKYIYPFTIENNNIKLPFAYAVQLLHCKRPERTLFASSQVSFDGNLREEQIVVEKEAVTRLSSKGSVMISCGTGFGKTAMSIKLSTTIRMRTLIIVNKIVLISQWKESIKKFCPEATVQCLTPKSARENVDYYIINAQNIEKMGKKYFQDIGLCIVDEVHLIVAESLSRCLQYIYPRYLIGLSATPYRPDGLDQLLNLYFGDYKIVRKLYCKHQVYRINTGFTPKVELTRDGRVDWGAILAQQGGNEDRNDLICRIIQSQPQRTFLVLVKRVEQGHYLLNKLKDGGESITNLIGSQQEFDAEARILIGTCQKVGVGFDHPRLDTLLLATDIEEYFIQYLGRVFRRKDSNPMIFDLVDNNPILLRHFKTRQKIYKECGGEITTPNLENYL